MLSHLTTSLLAGCALHAAAEAPAAVVSSLTPQELRTTPTSNNKRRRLLQKFKKRQQRAYDPATSPAGPADRSDVGILSNDTPRFLQDATDYDYYCPRDTCPTALCDCADSGGSLEECTEELRSVCRAGQLGDCVFSEYLQVYQDVYCPFVSCVGEGFHENQCDCAFYELYCNRLEGEECTPFIQTDREGPDKKPFFGCDETELAGICDEAQSCKAKGDLQGLPQLGTWQGSVQTGIKKSSGERMGAGVVAAVTVFSVILHLM